MSTGGKGALAVIVLVGLAVAVNSFGSRRENPVRPTLSLPSTLGGADTAGYARATTPRRFDFPVDHGPHPEFRTEWWYLTGNLETPEGHRFGYQLTVFRSALAPRLFDATSSWTTRQAYMAHFTVTEVEAGRFHASERFARGAMGLAGAQVEPFRVWLEDWVVESVAEAGGEATSPTGSPPSDAATARSEPWRTIFPLEVRASIPEAGRSSDPAGVLPEEVSVALHLLPEGPLVLQGRDGLSRKGPEPGNASYYYSIPRLATSGEVVTPAGRFEVRGTSWLDREWSTSSLPEGVAGWDWFGLQLDDGRALMLYGLRRVDGSRHPGSAGMLVDAAGSARTLGSDAFEVEVLERWTSPGDGVSYPSRWRIRVPGEGLELTVEPLVPDQELELTFRYWEGAVNVTGTAAGTLLRGRGYAELTGYAGPGPPGR